MTREDRRRARQRRRQLETPRDVRAALQRAGVRFWRRTMRLPEQRREALSESWREFLRSVENALAYHAGEASSWALYDLGMGALQRAAELTRTAR